MKHINLHVFSVIILTKADAYNRLDTSLLKYMYYKTNFLFTTKI